MMNRKMKQLAMAVGVALGGAGLLPSAQAVHVSPDNLGQTLIFPYYTVRGGWNTLLGITNTTDQVVAVKVRFREALNSRDVMDFDIILSPQDLWAATVYNTPAGPALSISADEKTCTVGLNSNPQPFPAPVAYTGIAADGGPTDVERMRSGYVEMIMMGAAIRTDNLGKLAVHDPKTGAPADCATLSRVFRGTSPYTPATSLTALGASFTAYPANALKGTFSLVNGSKGFNAVSLPTALANFRATPRLPLHAAPNGTSITFENSWHEPSLNSATTQGTYFDSTGVPYAGAASGAAAVTDALRSEFVLNEWSRNPTGTGPGGKSYKTATDWVIAFPTKHFHVDTATHEYAGRATAYGGRSGLALITSPAPFANTFAKGQSCDEIVPTVYNREEGVADLEVPSPSGRFQLCQETNVLTFNDGLLLGNVADDAVRINYPASFLYGWMKLSFNGANLPAVGFAVTSRDDGGGLLSEAAAYDHSIGRP